MDRKKISRVIQIYLADLSKRIKIDKAILFGTGLTGKLDKNSDIDLLILSSSFNKMDDNKRFDLLYTARENQETQSTPMDIFGLTPEEYAKASSLSVVGEIRETGKEIVDKN